MLRQLYIPVKFERPLSNAFIEHTLNKKLSAEVLRRIFSFQHLWIGFILQKCKDGRYTFFIMQNFIQIIFGREDYEWNSILTLFSINVISVNVITMAKE